MDDGELDVASVTDPILLSVIEVTKQCEASGDPGTLMALHIALQARCDALGHDFPEVLRHFLSMDAELDFPQFD